MSAQEIIFRLRSRMALLTDRLMYNGRSVERGALPAAEIERLWLLFRQSADAFLTSMQDGNDLVKDFRRRFPENIESAVHTANELLEHRINLFDEQFNFGEAVDWHRDPKTDRQWPQLFWASIDIRDGKTVGGVKWVWELNRHYHLTTLGKAYFLTGDERYAVEVITQLTSWIQQNPAGYGVNWTSSLELAIRMLNWIWALIFISHSSVLSFEQFALILRSIHAHGRYIFRHLSGHSSANNHLIGEAAGLAVIGSFFANVRWAQKWRDTGLEILTAEIGKQIYPDGVSAEQAFHYQIFVLDLYFMAWRFAEFCGESIPPVWYDCISAACDFLRHITDGRGNVPAIGDSDNAWVVRLDDRPDVNNLYSIFATAAVLLDSPELKFGAPRWDEKSHWLLGLAGLKAFDGLGTLTSEPASKVYQQGGYGVIRRKNQVLVMDFGPLGYLATAAHGHADALSLVGSFDEAFLVDPGTYAYQEGYEWRRYFRGTAAHNTIVVDHCDQSEIIGDFLWGRKAQNKLILWDANEAYDIGVAEHDGYHHLGVRHRRAVICLKAGDFMVIDWLSGEGLHHISQLWHFAAGCEVALVESGAMITTASRQIKLIGSGNQRLDGVVRCGEVEPIQGWVSPHYGKKMAAPVLDYSGNVVLPVKLQTIMITDPVRFDQSISLLENQADAILKNYQIEELL